VKAIHEIEGERDQHEKDDHPKADLDAFHVQGFSSTIPLAASSKTAPVLRRD